RRNRRLPVPQARRLGVHLPDRGTAAGGRQRRWRPPACHRAAGGSPRRPGVSYVPLTFPRSCSPAPGMSQYGAVNLGRCGRGAWAAGLGLALLVSAGCARGSAPVKALPLRDSPVLPGRVSLSHVRTVDGSKITIVAFRGSVTYVLHNGSADPGKLLPGEV